MNENTPRLVIHGRRGRKATYGRPMTKKIEVWVTEAQYADFQSVCQAEARNKSEVIRDAVDSYVGDFRERRVFNQPKPPSVERE